MRGISLSSPLYPRLVRDYLSTAHFDLHYLGETVEGRMREGEECKACGGRGEGRKLVEGTRSSEMHRAWIMRG
jgi:hypothetical protein